MGVVMGLMLLTGRGDTDAVDTDHVPVGPFGVLDASAAQTVDRIVDLAVRPERARLVYALHVGGLNERRSRRFVTAMRAADLVYADGGSVVSLARIAGATTIERAPTTDIGWDVFRELSERLGRPVRLALVGGPRGLAQRAAEQFDASGWTRTVGTWHGFRSEWGPVLEEVRETAPDVVVVGLGAPQEMVWCHRHRDELPAALVLTCGGWFGHVVGDEVRAPRMLRRSGLEWVARLWQQPARLGPRYLRGLWSCLRLVPRQLLLG